MSEPTIEPQGKPSRPLNRIGIGVLSVLQILLLGAIVLAANYLAAHHFLRADLSRDKDYTLSSATKRYLKESALASRERPVKWIMELKRTSPLFERVRAIAEEYERESKGKIQLEVVDPMRSKDRCEEVNAAYGLSLVREFMVIDARNDDSPAITEDANKIKVLNPHVKLALAEDMAVFTVEPGKERKRKPTAFQIEDVLTARLVEAIEGKPRKMALLADKSRMEGQAGDATRKSLEDLLRFQNVELVDLRLSETTEIPGDISGLILAAPKYDLSDQDSAALEAYWNRPRSAILVMLDGGDTPPKLKAFLRSKGITPRKDRVVTRLKNQLVTQARGTFSKGVRFIRDLSGQSTEFAGASCSLEVREGDESFQTRRIYPMPLIDVSAGFWGETKFGNGKETFDEVEDYKPPFHLAACVTRGDEFDDRFAKETSRMVVVSNTDFLAPDNRLAENLDFLASSVNWLIGREELAGIGPRPLGIYRLPILDAQVSFINRVNLFFLPAGLLLIGAFVWSSRRV
jgi:hypothetical protein